MLCKKGSQLSKIIDYRLKHEFSPFSKPELSLKPVNSKFENVTEANQCQRKASHITYSTLVQQEHCMRVPMLGCGVPDRA